MEKQIFFDLFDDFLRLNTLEAYGADKIKEKFYLLTERMTAVNEVMNITAIRDVEKIIPLHYMDCMMIAKHIPQNATVLDVGCGGGFPTLPLAIIHPDLHILALDSTEKKVKYVQETANMLGLNVKTVSERAEILAQKQDYREKFDVVTSRAVARLNILDELCMPFVKVGGKAVIMKGAAGQEEFSEAESGIKKLGGSVQEVWSESLYVSETDVEQRALIVIDKTSQTPAPYPRQFGQIKKKPL